MLKCNLGLPDLFGVDVTTESVLTWNHESGVASLTDINNPFPLMSEAFLEWQSLSQKAPSISLKQPITASDSFSLSLFKCSLRPVICRNTLVFITSYKLVGPVGFE